MAVIKLDENNFDAVTSDKTKTVLVDFFATWCGPCMMMAPVIDGLAGKNTDAVFCKVDVDECPSLAGRFGIQYIPTLIVFKDGKPVKQENGYHSEEEILKLIS